MHKTDFLNHCRETGVQTATLRDNSPRGCRTVYIDDINGGDVVLLDNHWITVDPDDCWDFEPCGTGVRATMYNTRGEKIIADFHCNEDRDGRAALLNIWTRVGYIAKDVVGVWNVEVQALLPDGDCRAWYNPAVKLHESGTRCQIVFEWIGYRNEEEKLEKYASLLAEIKRLANASEGDYVNKLRGATK